MYIIFRYDSSTHLIQFDPCPLGIETPKTKKPIAQSMGYSILVQTSEKETLATLTDGHNVTRCLRY